MQIAKGHVLSGDQRELVKGLLRPQLLDGNGAGTFNDVATHHLGEETTYAQRLEARVKRRKVSNDDICSQYLNLDILAELP